MANELKAMVVRARMASEYDGTLRVFVKITKDVENGTVFKIRELVEGEREIYTYADAVAGTDKVGKGHSIVGHLALMTTPEVVADPRVDDLLGFINKEDTIGTMDILRPGDYFEVTAEAFTNGATAAAEIDTNKYATTTAGGKITLASAETNAFAVYVGKRNKFYGFRVLEPADAAAGSGE